MGSLVPESCTFRVCFALCPRDAVSCPPSCACPAEIVSGLVSQLVRDAKSIRLQILTDFFFTIPNRRTERMDWPGPKLL